MMNDVTISDVKPLPQNYDSCVFEKCNLHYFKAKTELKESQKLFLLNFEKKLFK